MLKIRNWDKWQSYRTDRGQPPWIKVHRRVLRDLEWVSLTDAQKGQLICIWMLAADKEGLIPNDPQIIQKLCLLDEAPDLQLFIDRGFIVGDVSVTPNCQPCDAKPTPVRPPNVWPEAEAEAEAEAEEKRSLVPSVQPDRTTRKKNSYTKEFEAFWSEYPKRSGSNPKKTAFQKYRLAIKGGATHEEILAGVRNFQSAMDETDKLGTEFIPMAATWLNQERWNDEYESKVASLDDLIQIAGDSNKLDDIKKHFTHDEDDYPF